MRQLDTQRLTTLEQQRTLTFAEQRLLHQVNPNAPASQRLDALEASLYGQPSTVGNTVEGRAQTLDARLGRLRQSLPLNARRIGLQAVPVQIAPGPGNAPPMAPIPLSPLPLFFKRPISESVPSSLPTRF